MLVDGNPSSCRGKNCSFNFTEALTPVLLSISPTQGQGGTTTIIQGSDFGSDQSKLSVFLGSAPCEILACNDTAIECVACRHVAGTYQVIVSVEGTGRALALGGDALCFTYLLTLGSIMPTAGGVTGGYLINITGEGFLDFTNDDNGLGGFFGARFSSLPWFRHGLGMPDMGNLGHLNLCHDLNLPRLEQNLKDVFYCLSKSVETDFGGKGDEGNGGFSLGFQCKDSSFNLSKVLELFPAHVLVGDSPCLIMEAALDRITCVATIASPGLRDISVSIFDQQETVTNAFLVDADQTPIVTSVSPPAGPVSGGTVLTLTGDRFTTESNSNVTVTIGRTECAVESANATVVVCVVPPHKPSVSPIFLVSTASGSVAGLDSSLDSPNIENLFPSFERVLSAGPLGSVAAGSVGGGSEVVIPGAGFVAEDLVAFVGGNRADVLSVQEDSLVMVTPTSATTKQLYLTTIEVTGEQETCI